MLDELSLRAGDDGGAESNVSEHQDCLVSTDGPQEFLSRFLNVIYCCHPNYKL